VRQHYLIGLVGGAGLGAVAAALSGVLGHSLSLGDGFFWGAVVGGILAGAPQFAESGAVLTRRDNRALNTVVGVAGSLVVLGVIVGVALALTRLFW
jgi:hypothetical protein